MSTSSALAIQQPPNPNSGFVYHSLDKGRDQIRLVRILGNSGCDIRAEIKTFELFDNTISWKALSYHWGNDEATAYIVVGNEWFNQWFRVRLNLYDFLVQMKLENEPGWFFIDAICIDQNDVYERNHQVGLMGNVYKKASEVVVWIPMRGDRDCLQFQNHLHNLKLRDERGGQGMAKDQVKDVVKRHVLQNEYWSRLWVVQEVLLAHSITIRYGELPSVSSLSHILEGYRPKLWTILHVMEYIYSRVEQDRRYLPPDLLMSQTILQTRQERGQALRSGDTIAFHEAIFMFSIQNCEISHDKVFGLLGITQSVIYPDYSMSTLELYAATLTQCRISIGFDCEQADDHTDNRRFFLVEVKRILVNVTNALYIDFNLIPNHIVIFEMTDSILSCFGGGFISGNYTGCSWNGKHPRIRLTYDFILVDSGDEFEDHLMPWYINPHDHDKLVSHLIEHLKFLNEQAEEQKKSDNLLTTPNGETKRRSEWRDLGLTTCQEIWRRHKDTQEFRQARPRNKRT